MPRPRRLARAAAIDTPSMALAPSSLLVGVPSSAIIASSRPRWSSSRFEQRFGDDAVDVADGLAHAFAAVSRRVAIAQLERFALAGRRAGGHGGPSEGAALERHVDFDGRIAARIQDFAPMDNS